MAVEKQRRVYVRSFQTIRLATVFCISVTGGQILDDDVLGHVWSAALYVCVRQQELHMCSRSGTVTADSAENCCTLEPRVFVFRTVSMVDVI